jgi:hypothetical protein
MLVTLYSKEWAILRDAGATECGRFEARGGCVFVLMQ